MLFRSLVIDENHRSYITGWTASKDFPLTEFNVDNAFDDDDNGSDAFLVIINENGSDLLYSTYLGGSKTDVGEGLAIFQNQFIFITGVTSSFDFPTTQGVFNRSYQGKADAFVSKILPIIFHVKAGGNKFICQGDSILIGNIAVGGTGVLSYKWDPPTGLSSDTVAKPKASPVTTTTYTVVVLDESGKQASDSIVISVMPKPQATIYGSSVVLKGSKQNYQTILYDNAKYFWIVEGGYILSGQNTNKIQIQWTDEKRGKIKVVVENVFGCKDSTDNFNIYIGNVFKPVIKPVGSMDLCEGDYVVLDAGDGYMSYFWSDSATTRFDTIYVPGYYWVMVTDSIGFVGYSDTLKIESKPKPEKPGIRFRDYYLHCINIEPAYQWYLNNIPIPGATSKEYLPKVIGWYYVEITGFNGCKNRSDAIYVGEVSVDELSKIKFKIYPNPSDGTFHLNFESDYLPVKIEVYNLIMQKIKEFDFKEYLHPISIDIDLNQFSSGIYFIKITNGKNCIFEKIIKK